MKSWHERPHEIANLLNPAFCGEILRRCINTYQECDGSSGCPYPLLYLVLPIVLHKQTREALSNNKLMHSWLTEHQHLLVGFPERARRLVPITKDAITFLLMAGVAIVDENGALHIVVQRRPRVRGQSSGEVAECYKAAETVGKWFARAGSAANVYVGWGVKP